MSEGSGLFDKWTSEEKLPEPFQTILSNRGAQRYSTKPEDCSVYNSVVRGRSASLYPPTLRALEFLLEILDGGDVGAAVGMQQDDSGETNYYCIEYEKEEGRCAAVYNHYNGTFKGMCLQDGVLSVQPGKNSSGEEFIALMAYASCAMFSPLNDEEFSDNFGVLQEQIYSEEKDEEQMLHAAFICCDNLYRRIESRLSSEDGGLPVRDSEFREPLEGIPNYQIQLGFFSPNAEIVGEFQILTRAGKLEEKAIWELEEKYHRERVMSDSSRARVPKLPDSLRVSVGAQEILRMVDRTPARIFMITGEAGIGKTTDCRMIAQILGVPYFKLTCGPGTDETELLASPMPNMGTPKDEAGAFPSLQDFMMDPASALAAVSGTYQDGIEQETAFRQILSTAYRKGYEKAKKEKDFTLVESAIIQACREPSVLEIQEPAMIENSGTLTKLNGLLDDSRCTDLLTGETVMRHPDTIIILTTNLNYIGCRMFNESILSRMNLIQHREGLTKEQMVDRAKARTDCNDAEVLSRMADSIVKIQKYLNAEEIQGGVCGYRELENWVLKYLVDGNALWAVKDTVLSKAARLPEDRAEIMESYVLPYFTAA